MILVLEDFTKGNFSIFAIRNPSLSVTQLFSDNSMNIIKVRILVTIMYCTSWKMTEIINGLNLL